MKEERQLQRKKKRGIQKERIKNQSHLERKGEEKATRKKDTRQAVGEKEMKKVECVRKRERKLNFKPRPPRFSR